MAHQMEKFSRRTLFGSHRFYWRFRHQNGNIMADCAESYNSQHSRDKSYDSFCEIMEMQNYVEVDVDKEAVA